MPSDLSGSQSSSLGNCLLSNDCLFLTIDDTFLKIFAYERADMIGRPEHDFTFLADRYLNYELFDKLKRDRQSFSITKRYVRCDYALIWVVNHVEIDRDGSEIIRVTSSMRGQPAVDCDIVRRWQISQIVLSSFSLGKRLFGKDIVSSPPVEALLALYTAELDGSFLTIGELAARAKLADHAMARWIAALVERRLVEIVQGSPLSDTAAVRITQECTDKIDQILSDFELDY